MSNLPTFNQFRSPELNTLASELISLNKQTIEQVREAYDLLGRAVFNRFNSGKLVFENLPQILEECQSQRAFAKKVGISEGVLSNDLRAYRALHERGVTDEIEFKKLLDKKGLTSTVQVWERLPTLLEDPDSFNDRPKADKKLEKLYAEAEQIKEQYEGANPEVAERIDDTLKYIKDVQHHIQAQDVYKSGWRNRSYLNFVKSIGFDYLTWEPSEYLDPHHTLPSGSTSGPHGKVADVFTIPVTRATHNKIQGKRLSLEEQLQVSEALIRTMALFITTNMKSDE